jgi:hypothetical protein
MSNRGVLFLAASLLVALCASCGGRESNSPNTSGGPAATQSSDYSETTTAAKALDGDTDGSFAKGSVASTKVNKNAWWQMDLGASSNVSSIEIWNRTDCCSERLMDYWVFVSDTAFSPTDTPSALKSRENTWNSHQTMKPNPTTSIPVNSKGRYVRVQLEGEGYLSLAEVKINK